jgi:molecular chaperone GrpE
MSDELKQSVQQKGNYIKDSRLNKEIKNELKQMKELEEEIDEIMQEEQLPKSDLRSEVIDLQQELQAARDKLLYAYAEIENIRVRSKQDIEKISKYALEKFIDELIPVIDGLERTLENIHTDDLTRSISDGVQLTLKMLLKAIEKFGVSQIDPLHIPFDPKFHEAMSTQENTEVDSGTILSVLQKGYLLHGRLVRPALVIVSK